MNNTLQARLELFVENTKTVRKEFLMPHALVKQMAALLYTAENRPVDTEHIRACHNLIHQSTGLFSSFRGNLSVGIAAMLALSGNPQTQMENAVAVYKLMTKAKFIPGDTLTIAAFEIAAKADARRYEEVVQRAREFYVGMRRSKWWITGQDDYIYAAMLALLDLDVDTGLAHVDELHAMLKPHLRNSNSIQALSQVMAVSNVPEESVIRVLELRDATKAAGIRMDRQYTLSTLGILAQLPGSAGEIAEEIREAYEYLRKQRGFSIWANGQQPVLLLAAAVVSMVRAEAAQNELLPSNIANNINNIIVAENTAIIVACVAISSTVAASSSSSS